MWPLLLRGLLVGAAGFVALKLAEYVLTQQDDSVTKAIVDEEKRKRGLDPERFVIWAGKPTCFGTIFTEDELRQIAKTNLPSYVYDEKEKALRYLGKTYKK